MPDTRIETGYAPVNGLEMYYEIHGEGDGVPLVVLHGAYRRAPPPASPGWASSSPPSPRAGG